MMFAPKQQQDLPELGATAADNIRETYITRRISNLIDEETGNAWSANDGSVSVPPARVWLNFSDASESAEPERGRTGRARWISAGMVGLLVVVALSVGLAARRGGVEEQDAVSTAPEVSTVSDVTLEDIPADAKEEVKAKIEASQDNASDATASAAISKHQSKVPSLFDDILLSSSSADDVDGSTSESKPSFWPEPQRDDGDDLVVASSKSLVAVSIATSSSSTASIPWPRSGPTDSSSVRPNDSSSSNPPSAPAKQPAEPMSTPAASSTTRPNLSGWSAFRWERVSSREASSKKVLRPLELP